MKKLSQLIQEKNALENRLNRYISRSVKATKAMKVGLIFKIASLEVKIEKLQTKTKEETKMETLNLNVLLEKLFNIDFSDCEMSEDIEEEIRNVFTDKEILFLSENLYKNGKVIDLSNYDNDMDVIDIADYVSNIAYNIEKYELPMKARIESKKAIEAQVRSEFANGVRKCPKQYPTIIRKEIEGNAKGSRYGAKTPTKGHGVMVDVSYYLMPDGSHEPINNPQPMNDEEWIEKVIKLEIARQVK